MSKLGLTWSPIGRAKQTYASCRAREIKKFLIGLDQYLIGMEGGESNYEFVFTDEPYVNVNHGQKKSYLPKDKEKESELVAKSGKGRRLVILHAITKEGPWLSVTKKVRGANEDTDARVLGAIGV